MFQELSAPDTVIAVAFSDKVTKDDVRAYERILKEKLETYETVGLCVDFADMSDFTADALVEGTKADIELLSHLKQVKRVATVSDKEWPQAVMTVLASMIPDTQMKHFQKNERDSALAWAADGG